MSQNQLRVAIIGASGIGKNHAAWFQKNGADVVAFAGASQRSVARTREVLAARLGYAPRGYDDVLQLLQVEKPDAVCIASPPELHFAHARLCLQSGAHVLCEKPLIYDAALSRGVLTAQANELIELARSKKIVLATQMQYAMIAQKLCEMAGARRESVTGFAMEMETKNWKPGRARETVWIELAPHPLSVLQKIAGACSLDESSIRCEIGERETTAQFRVQRANGNWIEARIVARCNPNASTPRRRFEINGASIDCAGRKNAAGEFLTYLARADAEPPSEEIELPDLVDLLIDNFLRACRSEEKLEVAGEDGARNVEWLLKILERG